MLGEVLININHDIVEVVVVGSTEVLYHVTLADAGFHVVLQLLHLTGNIGITHDSQHYIVVVEIGSATSIVLDTDVLDDSVRLQCEAGIDGSVASVNINGLTIVGTTRVLLVAALFHIININVDWCSNGSLDANTTHIVTLITIDIRY